MLTLAFGPMEVIPASDNWPEEEVPRHELEFDVLVADRAELPAEFAALMEEFEKIFPEIATMDQVDRGQVDKEAEVPQLFIAE